MDSCIYSGVTVIQALEDVKKVIGILHVQMQYTTFDFRFSVEKL